MIAVVDIRDLADMLAQQIEPLARELFPAGSKEGAEFRVGSLAGEAGRSMAIHLTGSRAGVWSDFASGERGDAIDLIAHALFSGDKGRAVQYARRWLGIDDADPAELEQRRRKLEIARKAQDETDAKESEKNRAIARAIFFNAAKLAHNDPVDRYLRGRGIDVALLPRAPGALRFERRLWNPESRRNWPAMVAAISGPDGNVCAIHRTWLEIHGDGRVTKAPLREAKWTLGKYVGGCIRLTRGSSGKALNQAADGEAVLISEGIEDGLTFGVARVDLRVVAAVSLANLGSLVLPAAVATVIIGGQNEPKPNPQADAGVARGIKHFHSEGRRVLMARPQASVKDVNDLVKTAAS